MFRKVGLVQCTEAEKQTPLHNLPEYTTAVNRSVCRGNCERQFRIASCGLHTAFFLPLLLLPEQPVTEERLAHR
jgi:hypothetical protein